MPQAGEERKRKREIPFILAVKQVRKRGSKSDARQDEEIISPGKVAPVLTCGCCEEMD